MLLMWSQYESQSGDLERLNKLREYAFKTYLSGIKSAFNQGDVKQALMLMSHIEHHFGLSAEMYREQAAWLLEVLRI